MLQHKDFFHGSDLAKIEQIYGIKKEEIISFSANVNPLGISYRLKTSLAENLDAITSYPDRDYKELRECISDYIDAPINQIIVGNGSTELISLFIQTQHPKKALILGPTYSEYEREISLGGGNSVYYPLREEDDFRLQIADFCASLDDSTDLLVLCSPNNPTSGAITRHDMRQILNTCMQHGIFVMVDETYVEFSHNEEESSSVHLTNYYNNLIILRGTSKFFAAPGLRLGYAVTGNPDVREAINTRKNPWTINSLAEIAGRLMFPDKEYIAKTKELISTERSRITDELSKWNSVKVYPADANFLLVKILRDDVTAEDVFDRCIRRRMMIRNCSSFPFLDSRFFRFCFMTPADNDRLLETLHEVLE